MFRLDGPIAIVQTRDATIIPAIQTTHQPEQITKDPFFQWKMFNLGEDSVEMLTSMMGGKVDREMVRRVLRKYGGDVDKAATAMLEGELGEDQPQPQAQGYSQSQLQSQAQSNMWGTGSSINSGIDIGNPTQPAVRPNTPAIDLTVEDDGELQRAMRESMNTLQPTFGPSERPADPKWAVVPSSTVRSTFRTIEYLPW